MDLRLIQRLVRIMQKGEITDLELDDSNAGTHLRMKRGPAEPPPSSAPVVHVSSGAAPAAALSAPAPAPAAAGPDAPEAPAQAQGTPFNSPMVGTFYRAGSPDSDPFVGVGSVVQPDTVLCIIEAMKVMNEIKAELSGTVVEVLVENGEPVEFGQPLFLIKS
jgi:acetyl-CoA carboxylase biotin carboxyl carrier protein